MVAKIQVPKAILNFDNELYCLIVKRLKNVSKEEIELVYGKRIAQLIDDVLSAEEKYPSFQDMRQTYIV